MTDIISIGGRKWWKSLGDEGQVIYTAMFIEKDEDVLGKFVDESSYDILVDHDADFYLPAEIGVDGSGDTSLNESRLAFKFRKNVFTEEEQKGAFEGLYGAAVESNNRGLAAGPRESSQGARDWVTAFQSDILDYYAKGQPATFGDGLQDIIEKHKTVKDETRGSVWLRTKVEPEFGDYKTFFPNLMERLAELSIVEAKEYATKIKDTFISDTSYATAIWSGIAGFYGRYPRIPYGRPTAFTDHNREDFEKCYPFARKLDQ